ncbi:hypothetical protein C8Q80DRAFT_191562 [Daedaleopsis nitida]|nr:hypothetical protein C8Q80DRAFT_191562 [Daedaleopsis nitida]
MDKTDLKVDVDKDRRYHWEWQFGSETATESEAANFFDMVGSLAFLFAIACHIGIMLSPSHHGQDSCPDLIGLLTSAFRGQPEVDRADDFRDVSSLLDYPRRIFHTVAPSSFTSCVSPTMDPLESTTSPRLEPIPAPATQPESKPTTSVVGTSFLKLQFRNDGDT